MEKKLSVGVESYGMASLNYILEDVHFPISKQELIDQYGDEEVYLTESNPQRLTTMLRHCPEDRFEDKQDLLHAISQSYQEYGIEDYSYEQQ